MNLWALWLREALERARLWHAHHAAPRLLAAVDVVRSLRINSRTLLILLISGGQLICLLAGLVWFSGWLGAGLLTHLHQQVQATNEQFAAQTVETIRRMKFTELQPGQPEWERIQRIIEQTKLPNEGFLCMIEREHGRVICHPELKQNPILLSMELGQKPLESYGSSAARRPIMEAASGESSASGWVQMPDGRHLITVRALPELNVAVIAHQRERIMTHVIEYLKSSVWSVGLVVALLMTGVMAGLTLLIVHQYEHKLATLNEGLERQVQRRSRALMKTRDAVIFGLARLAESRHEDTGEHLDRIRHYVEVLAREVARHDPSLDEEAISMISLAATLHDIGKVAVPDEVLLKEGRLTPRQRALMRRHTLVGGDCLLAIKRRLGEDDFLTTACQIALSHHERWNGTGYPFGLKGDNIPLGGRIVALADVYDALTSDRVYKCAMSHEKARQMIAKAAGKQFDPKVVEAFLRAEHEFARMSAQAVGRTAAALRPAA